MLTDRQQLTLDHLKEAGIDTPEGIAAHCINKLSQRASRRLNGHRKHIRKHSIKYYQEILAHIAKQ